MPSLSPVICLCSACHGVLGRVWPGREFPPEIRPHEPFEISDLPLATPIWEQIKAHIILVAAFGAVFYILKLVLHLLGEMRHAATPSVGRVTAFAAVLLLALVATWLRARRRMVYGILELAFGCFTVWQSLGALEGDYAVVTVALLVGAFALTRGGCSIYEGYRARKDLPAVGKARDADRVGQALAN